MKKLNPFKKSLLKTKSVIAIPFLLELLGCGSNPFRSADAPDPAEDAALLLEKDRPSDAIKLLETALKKSPGEPKYISVLSAAYAQRAGIEPLSMARNLAGGNSSSESSASAALVAGGDNSSLISLFGVTPRATADSVYDINYAVTLLTVEVTQDQWLPGDQFKLAIFQTSASVLNLKILDKNEDGKLGVDEIANLTSASVIINQLAASQAILSQDPNDASSLKAAEALAKYQSSIASSEGSTDEEKLKNYLAKTSQSSSLSLDPSWQLPQPNP